MVVVEQERMANGECATFDAWVGAFGVELLFSFFLKKCEYPMVLSDLEIPPDPNKIKASRGADGERSCTVHGCTHCTVVKHVCTRPYCVLAAERDVGSLDRDNVNEVIECSSAGARARDGRGWRQMMKGTPFRG
jgi:hypothetical protein